MNTASNRKRKSFRNRKTGEMQMYCRIEKLLSTDHPRVKTAVLACGAQLRFDLDRRDHGRAQVAMVCPNCTVELQRRLAAVALEVI